MIAPILVGPRQRIIDIAAECGLDVGSYPIEDLGDSLAAAAKAVELVRAARAEALMKGSLHTDELMSAVVASSTGLRTGRRISHAFVMSVPTYPKPLIVTDAAINIAPTLEDKRDICQNAIDLAHCLGRSLPKVAILSAVETVTAKIPSTIDAAALCKMADRGQITGGLLDGPLAMDNVRSGAGLRYVENEDARWTSERPLDLPASEGYPQSTDHSLAKRLSEMSLSTGKPRNPAGELMDHQSGGDCCGGNGVAGSAPARLGAARSEPTSPLSSSRGR